MVTVFIWYYIGEHSSIGKESACSAEDLGSIPGSRRSPGEGNGNPLQYSCLENPMDSGPSRLPSTGSQESDMTERLSTYRGTECRFGIGPGSFLVIIKEGVE